MIKLLISVFTLSLVLSACSKGDEEGTEASDEIEARASKAAEQGRDDAKLSFAREQLAELDKRLASDDPGSASSICSVIKGDIPAIAKSDAKLAETLTTKCGRDLAVRGLERFVERAEAVHAKDPKDTFGKECSSFSIFMKPVDSAGAASDPKVAELKTRFDAVCPPKK
jgi:hypothetical protein